MTFLNYVQQYTKPFNDISSVLAELQSALACAERVYGVLDSPEVAETGKEELTSDQVKGAISFKQVSFGYHPEKILIKDLSIDIPAGSKVAIVGPTGAGKSTLSISSCVFIPLIPEISCWMGNLFMIIVVPLYASSLAWCSKKPGSSQGPFMRILPLEILKPVGSR